MGDLLSSTDNYSVLSTAAALFPNQERSREADMFQSQPAACLPSTLACRDRSLLAPPEHPFFCMLGFDALLVVHGVAETGLRPGCAADSVLMAAIRDRQPEEYNYHITTQSQQWYDRQLKDKADMSLLASQLRAWSSFSSPLPAVGLVSLLYIYTHTHTSWQSGHHAKSKSLGLGGANEERSRYDCNSPYLQKYFHDP